MNNQSKKKITELTETRWRTTHSRDEYGNRVRGQEEYIAWREVRSVSVGPRIGHFFADLLILQVLMLLVSFIAIMLDVVTDFSKPLNLSVELIGNITVLCLYPFLYAISEHLLQRTPGKYLTKTLVIDEYGNKPELKSIILRSIIRLVPFEPFSCFDNYSRGWHDEWSKTWVVTEEELKELKRLQEEQSINNGT